MTADDAISLRFGIPPFVEPPSCCWPCIDRHAGVLPDDAEIDRELERAAAWRATVAAVGTEVKYHRLKPVACEQKHVETQQHPPR